MRGSKRFLEAASAVDLRTEIVLGGLRLVTTPVEETDVLVENLKTKWKVQRIAPDIAQASRHLRD
jgi:hypothetical protein